jgi:hypothetical protein
MTDLAGTVPVPSVRLVTAAHLPDLAPDDQELLRALRRLGVPAEVAVWDDPAVDWSLAPVTVIRSVYDYHLRHAEFIAWIDRVTPLTSLYNPPEIIRWNSHKSYLDRIADMGFPIIPTEWVSKDRPVDLATVMLERRWTQVVVKPAVSASAHGTVKVTQQNLDEGQRHLIGLTRCGDALIQPYLREFSTVGETSVIWLGGEQTHGVRRPSGMDTPLEVAWAGAPRQPSEQELSLAGAVYQWITPAPLYARIDLLSTAEYGMLLLELELIEPALYLRHSPRYANQLASAIKRLVDRTARM